jgi:hypothetical protein
VWAFCRATSTLPNCVLSIRWSRTTLPPESRIAMTTFQLFFCASASAPAITFFACSSEMAGPYAGGGVCALAPEEASSTPTAITRKMLLMGSSFWSGMAALRAWDRLDYNAEHHRSTRGTWRSERTTRSGARGPPPLADLRRSAGSGTLPRVNHLVS